MGMRRIVTFKMRDEEYVKLRDMAEYYGVSVSEVIRWALISFLKKENQLTDDYGE